MVEVAKGINSQGQVIGFASTALGQRAFLWSPTVPNGNVGASVNLGSLPSGSSGSAGYGINSMGQVAGTGNTPGLSRAMLWSPATPNGTTGSMVALTGTQTFGSAINAMGQVVGGGFPSTSKGFLWTPTTPNGITGSSIELGTLAGSTRTDALAINNNGQVVGAALGPIQNAFLWSPSAPNGVDGTLVNLNTLIDEADAVYWQLASARGINDKGQIVGYGFFDADGPGAILPITRGFLLTPVPEPSALFLLLSVLAFIASNQRCPFCR
jgi:probable HAF family extracellular repeat protein